MLSGALRTGGSALEGLGMLGGPIGMTIGGIFAAGLFAGAAVIGAGVWGFESLAAGAAGVTSRRRFAMGIGSGYGEVSGFDLDFARFGADQGTLGAVAGGLYDVTSPQRIGLMTAGVTGGKDEVDHVQADAPVLEVAENAQRVQRAPEHPVQLRRDHHAAGTQRLKQRRALRTLAERPRPRHPALD
jgi:hypothetical protein